jgi:hypothetical protein
MSPLHTVPIDDLLRHRAWVQTLARSLVREAVAAGTTGMDVRLGRSATISGRLTDENGAEITATKGWMQAVPAGATPGGPGTVWIEFAEDGTLTSPPLDADRSYDLQAGMVPGHRTGKITGIVPGATDVVLRLPRATSISGTVTGPDGEPVGAGVPVLAIAQDVSLDGTPGSVAFAYTDSKGAFSIGGLGEFRYQVAAGGGMSRYCSKIPLRDVDFGSSDLALGVNKGAILKGRLLDKDGNAVKAPYLSVTGPGLLQFESFTRVETADGSFEIASLPAGAYRAAVVIGEERFDLGEVKIPSSDVELRLPE